MFREARYDATQLRRNRIVVALVTAAGIAACLVAGAVTEWPWANALGTAGLVLVFGAVLWWAFASRKAGPIDLDPNGVDRLKRTFWMS